MSSHMLRIKGGSGRGAYCMQLNLLETCDLERDADLVLDSGDRFQYYKRNVMTAEQRHGVGHMAGFAGHGINQLVSPTWLLGVISHF